MKKIKFRAWDKSGLMLMGNFELRRRLDNSVYGWIESNDGYELPIMQFTGLKDKNLKEIYEGDIVKLNNDKIAIVEYWVNGGQWVIHTPDFDMEDGQGLYQAYINQMEHKVIGNIYENPELLGKEKIER